MLEMIDSRTFDLADKTPSPPIPLPGLTLQCFSCTKSNSTTVPNRFFAPNANACQIEPDWRVLRRMSRNAKTCFRETPDYRCERADCLVPLNVPVLAL